MPLIKDGTLPSGNLEGRPRRDGLVILDESEPGGGPRLHRHPYDETWVVIEGTLTFTAGDDALAASPGDIVVVPPGCRTRSGMTAPGGRSSSASTPARHS